MDKDDLIPQYLEAIDEERQFDELVECEMEEMKIQNSNNIILLGNLLKEVTQQIKNKTPNLIKIRKMISYS